MIKTLSAVFLGILFIQVSAVAQNFTFDFTNSGRRTCLLETEVNLITPSVTIKFLDATSNTSETMTVQRRALNSGNTWVTLASNIPAGTTTWTDNNVSVGQTWEYQVRRSNTWNYGGSNYDAIGYTIGVLAADNSAHKGTMILLVANNVVANLAIKYAKLKQELTADGWLVQEIIVAKDTTWDAGSAVVGVRSQIQNLYNNAPIGNKPKALFILGHVPLPRSGATAVVAPDEHDENKGARGCDAYYADVDGLYTDTGTYNPPGLANTLQMNTPGDFKWDQDFFASDVELAFGRVDFEDIDNPNELLYLESYLDRLSAYKNVNAGHDMGDKCAFFLGYENSHDGTYRSLPNISKAADVFQNYTGGNHPQWVQNNGPFKVYMQNQFVPEILDWDTYGMEATVYTGDQSYWGFSDVPQNNTTYSLIRFLHAKNTKCLVALWTTTGINIFHQACTGQPLGIAVKEIMNHNPNNQKLEKAPQAFDTPEWWNRTHFAFLGDPTLNLYQVAGPGAPAFSVASGIGVLAWPASTDTAILGYNVYESSTELGVFSKINSAPIITTTYNMPNYTAGNWYMVKAVKMLESGCGKFIHPSLGKSVFASVPLSVTEKPFIALQAQLNENKKVELKWHVIEEINTAGYAVEKSSDANVYTQISYVPVNNVSVAANKYLALDETPYQKTTFYRVKQITRDGSFCFSNVARITTATPEVVHVYPNPASVQATLIAPATSNKPHSISICDMHGKPLKHWNVPELQLVTKLDLQGLSSGLYIVQITTKDMPVQKIKLAIANE